MFELMAKKIVTVFLPGRVAQSVTCLATDACLTADPGVASSIPVRSHTFVEIDHEMITDACLTADPGVASSNPVRSHTFVGIDHEMISTVILLPFADSFKKGCCQLQAKVCARITG